MKDLVIQLFRDSGYRVTATLEISQELTKKQLEETRSTLEVAYGPFNPETPGPSFFSFHKRLSELNPELAKQLMSFSG